MRRGSIIIAMVVSAALAAAGCGGSSGEQSSSNSASTSAPQAAKAAKESSGGSGGGGSASTTATDTIKDFTFTPAEVTVKSGGSVKWTDEDAANHNVIFDDSSVKGIENLREGESGTVTFSKPGTYAYVCTYHPGMKGTVVVK